MKELGNKLRKTIATIEKINSIPTLKSIPHPLALSNDKMRECRHWSNEDVKNADILYAGAGSRNAR